MHTSGCVSGGLAGVAGLCGGGNLLLLGTLLAAGQQKQQCRACSGSSRADGVSNRCRE